MAGTLWSVGVLECWSIEKRDEMYGFLCFCITPLLQYSTTPKAGAMAPSLRLENRESKDSTPLEYYLKFLHSTDQFENPGHRNSANASDMVPAGEVPLVRNLCEKAGKEDI